MKVHCIIALLAVGLLTITSCSISKSKSSFNKKEAEKALKERVKKAVIKAEEKIFDPYNGSMRFGSLKKDWISTEKECLINGVRIKVISYRETNILNIFRNQKRLGSIHKNSYRIVSEPGVTEKELIESLETFAGIKNTNKMN